MGAAWIFRAAPVLYRGVQMKRRKINKQTILYAILFAAFSLAVHFITVYLLCHGTGLLLAGGDMLNSPEKWEIREKAETIMGQAEEGIVRNGDLTGAAALQVRIPTGQAAP